MRYLGSLLASVALLGCAAPLAPEHIGGGTGYETGGDPVDHCLFGEHLDDLLYGGRFGFEDAETLTRESVLTGLEDKQLRTGAWDDGARDLNAVFDAADEGTIRVETLLSRISDHAPFTAYTYAVDGAPRGFVFQAASLDLVAKIDGGWLRECTAASAPPPGPCLFGETVDDLLYSGSFEAGEVRTLTADSELTELLIKHIMTGFRRDRVRSLEQAFARLDEGLVRVTTLTYADGGPAHEPFSFYTYAIDGVEGGFLFEGEDLGILGRVDGDAVASCRMFEVAPEGTPSE